MRIVESKRPGQEFLHDCRLQVVFRTVKQEANLTEQLLVRGKRTRTGLGRFHVVIHRGFDFILERKILPADRLSVKGKEQRGAIKRDGVKEALFGAPRL